MSHPLLKAAIRFFFIATLLLAPEKIAGSCSCAPKPTVLQAYEAADAVLIVRVLSLQTLDNPREIQHGPWRFATVVVERVYKGKVNNNERLVFGQSGTFSCTWSFDGAIDKEFLLYLKTPEKPDDYWSVAFCGRSSTLANAREDLLYLDNREKVRGKTRVSGRYLSFLASELIVAGRRIRILGEDKVYETLTDDQGVFEIYDLPPGKYRLEPEIPTGWTILGSYPRATTNAVWKRAKDGLMHFVLEAGKHASINVMLRLANAIEGSIVGPNGDPLVLCARLWTPDETFGTNLYACTDKDGHFRFEAVPPGTYIMVINPSGQPSTAEPFPRFFYPGTQQREKAALITVAMGETVRNINMVVPTVLETVSVEGVLYFSDEQPARNRTVRFVQAITNNNIDGSVQADTDEDGRFSLKIIKGLSGRILSTTYGSQGTYVDCPEYDALVKDSSENPPRVSTPVISIKAEQDLQNLVLRFPFPNCKLRQ